MSNIRLLRHGASTRVHGPGASPTPAPIPRLGREWWTSGWQQATEPLDDRCEQLHGEIRRAWGRVRDFSNPLGTVFYGLTLGERLPAPLVQGILGIPDLFAQGEIVLRKVKDGESYFVRVCDPAGETVGMVEVEDLLRLDHYLEQAAHWLLAHFKATPERITELLERELPTR